MEYTQQIWERAINKGAFNCHQSVDMYCLVEVYLCDDALNCEQHANEVLVYNWCLSGFFD